MNAKIIEITDRISNNEDIWMDEFKLLRWYIHKSNKCKTGNSDDVLSNYVLDVRENYNSDMNIKQKEAWIYAHIKHAITTQARFDWAWTLYNPIPIPTTGYDIEWWLWPAHEFQVNYEYEELDDICNIFRTPLEKDIYMNCILWNTPVAHVAKRNWKSAQWWKIIKDRIAKRVKDYIENKHK